MVEVIAEARSAFVPVVGSREPGPLTDAAQGLTQAVVAPHIGRLRLTELEAEGIMRRWNRDARSVVPELRDRAFELVHGKPV